MAYELAFIGAGNMAEAIARGLISSSTLNPDQMIAADVAQVRRDLFSDQLKIKAVESISDAARDAKVVLLAVKPQQMVDVLALLGTVLNPDALVISIAAGISTRSITGNLGHKHHWRVIRTMPNTPMLVGQGAVAIAPGEFATPADVAHAKKFFEPAAVVTEVTEDKIDAVTALSGSGPAYVFYLIEHMIAAGVELGLTQAQAELLAKQTVVGSATMAKSSTDTPQELRRKVTSPGGTTQAAIEHMDAEHVGTHIRQALHAAWNRSRYLGSKS